MVVTPINCDGILAALGELVPRETLKYGINPHHVAEVHAKEQQALFYSVIDGRQAGLSATNVLDMNLGMLLLKDYSHLPGVAVVKHVSPTGVAIGSPGQSLSRLYKQACETDPQATHGTAIINGEVDLELAQHIGDHYHHLVAARSFTADAKDHLTSDVVNQKMRGLRLATVNFASRQGGLSHNIYQLFDGSVLVDTFDDDPLLSGEDAPFSDSVAFGHRILSISRSLSVVIVHELTTIASCAGHQNAIDALEDALTRASTRYGGDRKIGEAIVVTDGCFGVLNPIQFLAGRGVRHLVIAGGKHNDELLVEEGIREGVCVTLTGQRAFKH